MQVDPNRPGAFRQFLNTYLPPIGWLVGWVVNLVQAKKNIGLTPSQTTSSTALSNRSITKVPSEQVVPRVGLSHTASSRDSRRQGPVPAERMSVEAYRESKQEAEKKIRAALPDAWGTDDLRHKLQTFQFMQFYGTDLTAQDFIDAYNRDLIKQESINAAVRGIGSQINHMMVEAGRMLKAELHPEPASRKAVAPSPGREPSQKPTGRPVATELRTSVSAPHPRAFNFEAEIKKVVPRKDIQVFLQKLERKDQKAIGDIKALYQAMTKANLSGTITAKQCVVLINADSVEQEHLKSIPAAAVIAHKSAAQQLEAFQTGTDAVATTSVPAAGRPVISQRPPEQLGQALEVLQRHCQLTPMEQRVIQNNLTPAEVSHPELAKNLEAFRALSRAILVTMENDFVDLFRSGLLHHHLESIEQAQGNRQALKRVHQEITDDQNLLQEKIVQSDCDVTKNTGAYVGRLGNGCWSSTGIQFMISSRDEDDIEELEEKLAQHAFQYPSEEKVAQALVDMWRITQRIERGEMGPVCMVGHQRRFITGCYEYWMATKHLQGANRDLTDLFKNGAFGGEQHDADEFYSAVDKILPVSNGKAVSTDGVKLSATYQGLPVSKTRPNAEVTTHTAFAVPQRKKGVTLLVESLSDQDAQQLAAKHYPLHEQVEMRDALLNYRRVIKAHREDQGEGQINAALGRLKNAVDTLCRSVSPTSNLIVDSNNQLLVDAHERDGSNRVSRGVAVPTAGGTRRFVLKIANVDRNDAEVQKLQGGGQVLAYPDGATNPQEIENLKKLIPGYQPSYFCRPIARVNREGRLIEPSLAKTRNMAGFDAEGYDVLAPGQLVLDSDGRFLGNNVQGLQHGQRVIDPSLAEKMQREGNSQGNPEETLAIATGLAEVLGHRMPVTEDLRRRASGSSMQEMVQGYFHEGAAGKLDWSHEDLVKAGVPANNCRLTGEKLESSRAQVKFASKENLKKLSVKLNCFSYVGGERVFRKDDAKSVIMNGGGTLVLPMQEENGEKFTFRGKLTSLACHGGGSASGGGGHYINLKIGDDGKIHVKDELFSLPLEEYAIVTNRRMSNGQRPKTLNEFLGCTDFAPQIAFYQRLEETEQ
ncbi:hypothetical protein [Parendozoicomonas sp. Alg238-R29]|uniref:hypothetical protein n=1 Tax=Parendozoicomonas sp. Alg238-R29 TaxID=2993446 RepID=UPI00248DDA61|nr:hypothetical protein [Parendozoicomonas sp. Alg238-R29]